MHELQGFTRTVAVADVNKNVLNTITSRDDMVLAKWYLINEVGRDLYSWAVAVVVTDDRLSPSLFAFD